MPLFEDQLISPLAVRFSQTRVRPTFQDGRELELAFSQIEACPCELPAAEGRYSVLLRAPFPPIEIIRWHPRRGGEDKGRWITLDNRRLCCLQRAAVKQWPGLAAACVRVLYDMPLDRSAVRKMEHAAYGTSVNVSRFHDDDPPVWDWAAAAGCCVPRPPDASLVTLSLVKAEASAPRHKLLDAPEELLPPPPPTPSSSNSAQLLSLAAGRASEAGSALQAPTPVTLAHEPEVSMQATSVSRLFQLAAEEEAANQERENAAAGQVLLSMIRAGASPSSAEVLAPTPAWTPAQAPQQSRGRGRFGAKGP